MSINKDIPELLNAGVISEQTADKIRGYYKSKDVTPPKTSVLNYRLMVVFGILGAILIGLGIILIIAHNWDELSRGTKTCLAFLPLLTGQGLCLYTLLKKENSMAWVESSSTFLFFAVGACIALVSQVYNISGDGTSFILAWILLCLPVMYVMRSSTASLLYLIGITYFVSMTGYKKSPDLKTYIFWPLLFAAIPYYYMLYKRSPFGNFTGLHNWFIPVSLFIGLNSLILNNSDNIIAISYVGIAGIFYMLGNTPAFKDLKVRNNGPLVLGSLGTVIILFTLSFDNFWNSLIRTNYVLNELMSEQTFYITIIIGILYLALLVYQIRKRSLKEMHAIEPIFLLFIMIFIIGLYSNASVILINILILFIGVMTVREGAQKDHLGILNYGLFLICVLISCRFFDTDISFVLRGVLFVLIGLGFLLTNYWMVKIKRKNG